MQLPAGPSYLCDLSEELLYCVTQHLAPRDQQNLFLTCRQLYSAWRIQLRDSDHVLRLVTSGLQCLESMYSTANAGSPYYHVELQCFLPSRERVEDIQAKAAPNQHSKFSCTQSAINSNRDRLISKAEPSGGPWRSGGRAPVNVGCTMEVHCWPPDCWKAQTSSQILHRLTASPDSASICLVQNNKSRQIARACTQLVLHPYKLRWIFDA